MANMTCPSCNGTGEQRSRVRSSSVSRSGSERDGNVIGPPADCSTCSGLGTIPVPD